MSAVTHWDGCWRHVGHLGCAHQHIIGLEGELQQLRARVAELERERDGWGRKYDEAKGRLSFSSYRQAEARANAAEAKVKLLREALRDAEPLALMWAGHYMHSYLMRDGDVSSCDPTHRDILQRIRTALRESGMEEAPEPAMHYDSSGRPMHPVSECRPGVCWTDEPAPADLILKPLPRAEEMKRLLSRGDGEEG